jgi:glucosamine kinase
VSDPLYVGLDAGGTTTRAVVVDLLGRRLGTGVADGGNPTVLGATAAVRAIEVATRQALAGVDPTRVRAATIGMSGADLLDHDPVAHTALIRAWQAAGMSRAPHVRSDVEVAFAAGTTRPDGVVLVAGTGAAAALLRDRRAVRCADGYGWLLGDAGSGFWLGRRAAKATLAAIEVGRAGATLPSLVLAETLGEAHRATEARALASLLVTRISGRPPLDLARLAPLVFRAAELDDADAKWLCQRAAAHLCATAGAVLNSTQSGPQPATDIVLAGGLLTNPTPVADALRELLVARQPQSAITVGRDGAAGAAWLAALDEGALDADDLIKLHSRLMSLQGE